MKRERRGDAMSRMNKGLLFALLAYASASLFHHVHNATFLAAYPNMPPGLSMLGVYAAWGAVTAVGVIGYALVRMGYGGPGLLLLAVYGGCGLDGLAHYVVAEFSAHSLLMHLSILSEVVTGLLLIALCIRAALHAKKAGTFDRPVQPG